MSSKHIKNKDGLPMYRSVPADRIHMKVYGDPYLLERLKQQLIVIGYEIQDWLEMGKDARDITDAIIVRMKTAKSRSAEELTTAIDDLLPF